MIGGDRITSSARIYSSIPLVTSFGRSNIWEIKWSQMRSQHFNHLASQIPLYLEPSKNTLGTFLGRKTKAWGASRVDLGLPCNGGWRLTNRVVAAPGFHQANKANSAPIRIVHIARGTQQSAKIHINCWQSTSCAALLYPRRQECRGLRSIQNEIEKLIPKA